MRLSQNKQVYRTVQSRHNGCTNGTSYVGIWIHNAFLGVMQTDGPSPDLLWYMVTPGKQYATSDRDRELLPSRASLAVQQ
jgi:hypothetical protein